jgi:hypothetical protein
MKGPSPPPLLSSSHIDGGGPRCRLPPARLDARCEGLIGRATGGGGGYDDVDYDDREMQARKRRKGEDDARELIDVASSIVVDNTRA